MLAHWGQDFSTVCNSLAVEMEGKSPARRAFKEEVGAVQLNKYEYVRIIQENLLLRLLFPFLLCRG